MTRSSSGGTHRGVLTGIRWYQGKRGPVPIKQDQPVPVESGEFIGFTHPLAVEVHFLPSRFMGWMWRDGHDVYIPFVACLSPGQGHFSMVVRALQARGYMVKIPTPMPQMEAIVKAKGFHQTTEFEPLTQMDVEVWVSP